MDSLLLPWIVASRKRKNVEESEKAVIPRKRFHVVPQFRLIYYDAGGPVELSRMILAYSGIPFDDVRLKTEAEWILAIKASPNKDLPILEWNTKKLCDGNAIARMLANMYGLGGNGLFEQAQADSLVGVSKDCVISVMEYITHKFVKDNPSTKYPRNFHGINLKKDTNIETMYFEAFEPTVKKYFGILENHASQSSSGFFLDSGVSYVDFGVSYFYEFLHRLHPELMEKYSNVQAITKRVSCLPELEIYLANRRKTDW